MSTMCSHKQITHAWTRTKTDRKSAIKNPSVKKWILMSGNVYSQLPTQVVISRKNIQTEIFFLIPQTEQIN